LRFTIAATQPFFRATALFGVEETEIMTNDSKFSNGFCSEYEQLLLVCQRALETWAKRREEAWQMGLNGKQLGNELIRLQANFAKSYATLRKHTQECPACSFVANIADRERQGQPVVVSNSSYPA
jgi:hypothetical protein